jgi:hypothetical protein
MIGVKLTKLKLPTRSLIYPRMSMSDNSYEGLINRCASTFVIAVTTVDDAITHELMG